MPRVRLDDDQRMKLRVRPAPRVGREAVEESERIVLSERDSLRVLKLLDHPPAPNAKLRAAVAALAKQGRLRTNR